MWCFLYAFGWSSGIRRFLLRKTFGIVNRKISRCSSVGRALDLGSRGRWFEPSHFDQQDVEKKVDSINGQYSNFSTSRAMLGFVVQQVRTPACHAGGRGFKSHRSRHLVPSTNRLGHSPFKAAMQGSNPAGITIISQGGRLAIQQLHKLSYAGSNPVPATNIPRDVVMVAYQGHNLTILVQVRFPQPREIYFIKVTRRKDK